MGQAAGQFATFRAREQDLARLIGRVAEGDQTALSALYDETSPLVYGLALRILRDQFAAEDVAIEVYTQAYRQASAYDPKRGSPSAWLVTLTRSRAIDRLRADSQTRAREEPLERAVTIRSLAADPEECSVARQLRDVVRAALAGLSVEQRQVIELAYYSGLSHTEIAAKLGEPLGTVKTRIRTGMMRLHEHLRPLLMEGSS